MQRSHNPLLSVERVPCVLCGSRDSKRLFAEQYALSGRSVELGINRCRNCELVYVSPRLTVESTRLVYEVDTSNTISSAYCWHGSENERRFEGLLERLAAIAGPGKLLDIGCGRGQFLRAARRTGRWRVVGVEPMPTAAKLAGRYAECEVRCATLQDAGFDERSFDVITLLGVLEHLHDPVAVLRATRNLLKEKGVVAAYVPNFNYLRLKDSGPICYVRSRRWSKLHPQEHLVHYTTRTLTRMLEVCGFDVLRVDVGRPFASGHAVKRTLKGAAYWATCALKRYTGIHLGGLEIIARANSRSSVSAGNPPSGRRMTA